MTDANASPSNNNNDRTAESDDDNTLLQDFISIGVFGENHRIQHAQNVLWTSPLFEGRSWKHFEAIFFLMTYHSMAFLSMLSIGFTFLQFMSVLLGQGMAMFQSPATYFFGIHMLLIAKLTVDYCECHYIIPGMEADLVDSRFLKHVPDSFALGLTILAYYNIFVSFYNKRILIEAESPNQELMMKSSFWFILSVIFVFYITIVLCLNESRPTIFLHQLIQNGLAVKLGQSLAKLGTTCGILLLFDEISMGRVVLIFVGSVILTTTLFVILICQLFARANMRSGSKTIELVWAMFVSNFLFKAFLTMNTVDDVGISCINFHAGIAFSISLTTRLLISHFLCEPGRTRTEALNH